MQCIWQQLSKQEHWPCKQQRSRLKGQQRRKQLSRQQFSRQQLSRQRLNRKQTMHWLTSNSKCSTMGNSGSSSINVQA
jgi:hypothetical protein